MLNTSNVTLQSNCWPPCWAYQSIAFSSTTPDLRYLWAYLTLSQIKEYPSLYSSSPLTPCSLLFAAIYCAYSPAVIIFAWHPELISDFIASTVHSHFLSAQHPLSYYSALSWSFVSKPTSLFFHTRSEWC